ncbi:MAG: methionyl-tRNA formyltransferase [Planctomycetota bacterium]
MRLVFLGSPPFALPILSALIESDRHEVLALVTPPDRPRGRGRAVEASPLVELAREHGLAIVQPETTKSPEFEAQLRAFAPDVLVVASYGEILRQNILDLAPHGALNVHGSLLPRWRGASPVQAAILAGDPETGVSVQRMVLALDAGDILHEIRTPIHVEDTGGTLFDRLSELGARAILEALDRIEDGHAEWKPQDAATVTHCRKIPKDAGRLHFDRPAAELERLVRAMNPWPATFAFLPDGRRLTLLRAEAVENPDPAAAPGTLLDDRTLLIACGDGALHALEVKPEGKRAMSAPDFLRGAQLPAGVVLESDPSTAQP